MGKTLLKRSVALLLMVIAATAVYSQRTMDVSKFTKMENDLMARVTKPVRDKDEGKLCALIRVVTNLDQLEFRADALGIVQKEEHGNETWLYVPYGAKSISFSRQGYFPLLYQYALPIEEGMVYELRLGGYETAADGQSQSLTTQMFVLTHYPDQASVYIDDMEVPTEHGVFAAMMSKGDHTYKVTANQYEDAEGSFTLADQPLRETVNLQPLFGTFQLFTLPENDFNVSINGKQVGISPYKSERLEPGSYRIHIEKEKYYPVDTLVRLREGDNLQLTCTLTSFADSLFYNRQLGGRRLSFGINVGYVQPFATSSASGFTGSPLNYSLANGDEDVSYSSQSGFTVGLMADYRLYKNFYLMLGVNYTHYKYSNKFNYTFPDFTVMTINNHVYSGEMVADYKEDYTLGVIEIPILASYRFVLTKTGSLHINLGPYISFGLNAKMKFSGSAECNGEIYDRTIGRKYDTNKGSFMQTHHTSGEFDLYSKKASYTKTVESGGNLGAEVLSEYEFEESPFKRVNFGLKLGVTYELRGFQFGIGYNLQLSNMANKKFWESSRMPVFNNQIGDNNMSGYKHRIHSLEFKVGYILRY